MGSYVEELALTVVMAVQVVCDLERQEGTHAHCQGSQHFVTNVEVVVRVATALSRNDAVVRILDRVPRHGGSERWSHLHALENEIDAVALPPLHLP